MDSNQLWAEGESFLPSHISEAALMSFIITVLQELHMAMILPERTSIIQLFHWQTVLSSRFGQVKSLYQLGQTQSGQLHRATLLSSTSMFLPRRVASLLEARSQRVRLPHADRMGPLLHLKLPDKIVVFQVGLSNSKSQNHAVLEFEEYNLQQTGN